VPTCAPLVTFLGSLVLTRRNSDPVLLSSFREMLVVLAVWIAAGVWSIGYCYTRGYISSDGTLGRPIKFIYGFPDWVFWGIVVPWVLCALASLFVSLFVMRDEDLGVDPEEEELDDA
jgi:hypothetical protein